MKYLGKHKASIFFELQRIIVDQLCVEENLVHLDSNIDIGSNLYANNRRLNSSSRNDLNNNAFNFFGMSISSCNNSNDDHLDFVELMMAIEEEFDIEIPDEAAEQLTTVQQAVDYVHSKLSA
ncbi:hypothetical protein UH38_05635 [Aliterella atlantica CENA595]|uniref:Acyl carrier protein n=1 Tax=Aliterella atlantica CENA595 TaxID=1618023 RepID=A0A0D8ZVG2_9CYAN|nr:hypothetical protein UH38_05635 [Aliterella atlantica CENA595]